MRNFNNTKFCNGRLLWFLGFFVFFCFFFVGHVFFDVFHINAIQDPLVSLRFQNMSRRLGPISRSTKNNDGRRGFAGNKQVCVFRQNGRSRDGHGCMNPCLGLVGSSDCARFFQFLERSDINNDGVGIFQGVGQGWRKGSRRWTGKEPRKEGPFGKFLVYWRMLLYKMMGMISSEW